MTLPLGPRQLGRRPFIFASLAAASGLLSCGLTRDREQPSLAQSTTPSAPETPLPLTALPERVLGRTGLSLPILGLGGAGKTPLSWPNHEAQATAIIHRALELGVRYFDTAASYGPSEDYLGKVLSPYREQIFLASKTSRRTRDDAWRQLEQSLTRLQTDYLDLWQMHHVSFQSELDTLFGPDGAMRAVEEAQAQGLIRFVGITGHHEPEIINEGLRRYPFHTALIPVNAADKHHPRPFIPSTLPLARQENVGIIAMKVPAYGRLFKPGILDGMSQAFGYALSQPGVHCAIIAAETPEQLAENVQVAQAFQPLPAPELASIEAKTAAAWQDNTFFRAWT